MMTAPEPPVKMAPVMAKKRKMYSLCWKTRLKKKMKMQTPMIDQRRMRRCWAGSNGLFRNGITTSWMKMLPHECR